MRVAIRPEVHRLQSTSTCLYSLKTLPALQALRSYRLLLLLLLLCPGLLSRMLLVCISIRSRCSRPRTCRLSLRCSYRHQACGIHQRAAGQRPMTAAVSSSTPTATAVQKCMRIIIAHSVATAAGNRMEHSPSQQAVRAIAACKLCAVPHFHAAGPAEAGKLASGVVVGHQAAERARVGLWEGPA